MKNEARLKLLWEKHKAGDTKARTELIEHYVHLVYITAGRMAPKNHTVERDDLIGAGMIGLIRAVNQFDMQRGILFETYAITMIRGRILEFLREDDWVPRMVRDQIKAVYAATLTLTNLLGRDPTDDEIAAELGVSVDRYQHIHKEISRSNLMRLDSPLHTIKSDDRTQLADVITDPCPSPEKQATDNVYNQSLLKCVDQLPPREARVIRLYYGNEKTYKEIGIIMGISESRAYQLAGQAIMRLRIWVQE